MPINRLAFAVLILGWAAPVPAFAQVPKPPALVAQSIPPIPDELAANSRPYMESRTAGFSSWNSSDRSMLITTRFGNTSQLHSVAAPMAMRRQISFEDEPVRGSWSPAGDVLVVSKDSGGDEFYQLYTLSDGRLRRVTDGKGRNNFGSWSKDGQLIGYSSTRRNDTDTDLYVVDPRDPATDRLVARVEGGGWNIAAFSPDRQRAVARNYVQVTNSDLYLLDLSSGAMTPIGDISRDIAYGAVEFAPDGNLWVTSDEDSQFKRLGRLDAATGRFTPVVTGIDWDVSSFDIAPDGSYIAFVTNEAGISRVRLLDPRTGSVRIVEQLPQGIVGGVDIAPWGTLGLTLSSATNPADAFTVDPNSLNVTRWTQSETGGLDPADNVEPVLVETQSFDGERVSGFLYRPDPRKFPGDRPLIVSIHGGPESQFRPGFRGRSNYYLNELGIALFYPNVRGSTGYGKRFVSLDNGPFRREDSVKDIGALMDAVLKDPAIDGDRIGITGGSYGGYMCYASAIAYADRVDGALCNVAISNFVTFLENTQSYRRDLRRVEYGDERDPVQRAKLLEISPLSRIDEIRSPLFVVQGANDPRVPASEAEQIVEAVRAGGNDVWYLLGQNEGHGFSKKENQDYLFWSSLLFWRDKLFDQ